MANLIPLLKSPSNLEHALSGLGQGISDFAQRKVAQMQQREKQSQLADALKNLGYSPDQAALINQLPEKDLLGALQSLAPSGPQRQQIQQPQQQPLQEYQQQQQPQQQQIASSIHQALGQLKQETPSVSGLELLKQMQSQKLGEIGLGQKQAQQPGFAPINANELLEQARLNGITLSPEQHEKINKKVAAINASEDLQKQFQDFLSKNQGPKAAVSQEQISQVLNPQPPEPLFKKPLTELEKQGRERLELKKEERAENKKTQAYKLTKDERKEINDKVKAARGSLNDLDRLEELEKEDKLDTPGYLEFLKRSGLDIPALLNEGSQEYNKVVNNFVREAKNVYGARISNQELEQFLKTLPSLLQSPAGRKRVIANLRYIKNADLAYGEALKEVIRDNDGIPPLDLTEEIDDRISSKLDSLSKRFKSDLSKPVPQGQNRLITALQAALGNATGAIPGALKGAAKGAVVGSLVPGLGTGVGAALGAVGGGSGII